MNRESLVISLIAQSDKGSIPLVDEDFSEDPEGEWINENGGWGTISLARHLVLSHHGFIHTFNPFTPEEARQKLRLQAEAERQKDIEKFEARISGLKRYRMVTTYEFRLVRYANKRAEEIILLNDQKYI